MTALVTGAPGWLGLRLVAALRARSRAVRCVVCPAHWAPSDLRRYAGFDDVEVVWGDLREADTARRAVRDVETVFHLASVRFARRPQEFFAVNAKGAQYLAEAALSQGVSRFVNVSSISVHGHNRDARTPFVEADPVRPETPYARSKAAGEDAVREAAARGLSAVSLRPGPFYGPGFSPTMKLLMKLVASGRAPRVDPPMKRSFAHVDNVVDALLEAEGAPPRAGEAYLIGDARPYTTLELCEAMADALSVPLRTAPVPLLATRASELVARLGHAATWSPPLLTTVGEYGRHSFAAIERATRELGYAPRRGLRDGIREAVASAWSNPQAR